MTQKDIKLYQGHASPKDIVLRPLEAAPLAASTTIYLYQGAATAQNVVLRNPLAVPSPSVSAYSITALHGTYATSGQTASLQKTKLIVAINGTYSLAGQTATVLRSKLVAASHGTYSLVGQDATVSRNRVVTPLHGVYSLSGQSVEITFNYTLTAEYGVYAIGGQSVAIDIADASLAGGAGSKKKKHRRIHPREIWEEPEAIEDEKVAVVAQKKTRIVGKYAEIPLADLEYAIAKLEQIVGADYDEDDVEALLLML